MKSAFSKRPAKTKKLTLWRATVAILSSSALVSQAATLYWDGTDTGGGASGGQGGSGTWYANGASGATTNWWNGTTNQLWNDNATTPIDIANFEGTAGTVTLSGTVVANTININTTGYTFQGGSLNFRGTSPTINVGANVTTTFVGVGNNQNAVPAVTIAGTSTSVINWGVASAGTQISITGGALVNLTGGSNGTSQNIGGGTDTITEGTMRITGGTVGGYSDIIYDTAIIAGTALGTYDMNGRNESVGAISGVVGITSTGGNSTLRLVNGNTTHTGVISDGTGTTNVVSLALGVSQNGSQLTGSVLNQTLKGANTFTGTTTLGKGTLGLDFTDAVSPESNILYNGVTENSLTVTGNTSANVNNNNLSAGSSLVITGKANTTNSQTFSQLNLNTNSALNVQLNPNATSNTVTLNLGAITRASGALVNFGSSNAALSANATVNTTSGTAGEVLRDANGIAYATLGGTDWAAKDGTNTKLVAATYTANTTSTLANNANVASGVHTRLNADTTTTTFRNNLNERRLVDLGGNTLTTGGVLVGSDMRASGSGISGGNLTSSGNEVVVIHHTAGGSNFQYFGVGATVKDGSSATGFTKGGSGTTLLTGNSTFTGTLALQQGGLIVTGTNTPGDTVINGGTSNGGTSNYITGTHLQGGNTNNGTFLQLGNGGTTGSIGNGNISIGVGSVLAIKRSDDVILNNIISGQGGLTQAWSGTTILNRAAAEINWLGDTTVTAGILRLDYSTQNNSKINDNSQLVLGGGTLETTGGNHSETVRATVLISGNSTVQRTVTGTGLINLNAITTSNQGATLNIVGEGIAKTNTVNTAAGIMNGRIIIGGADWAVSAASGSGITVNALPTYTALGTSGTDTNNALITNASAALSGNLTTNTIKIANTSGTAQSMDIGAGRTLTLTGNGLLVTGTADVAINDGTLRSNTGANSDLIIHQYSSAALTIGSVIANGNGNSGLTKSGTGTLILTGANTYTGTTYLNGGITSISSNTNLGAAGTGAQIHLNNATLQATATFGLFNGTQGTNNRNLVLNGIGGTIDVTAANVFTVAGTITGAGALTKTGTGTLTIAGTTNTYSGPTAINNGILKLGAANSLSVFSDLTINSTSTLDMAGFSTAVGSLSGVTGTVVTNTGAAGSTLTTGALHTDTTFAGTLQNGTGTFALTKIGYGTLTLTGTNTYTGATVFNGGVVSVSNIKDGGTASNLGQSTNAASNLVFDSGTLRYTGAAQTSNRLFTLTANGGIIDASGTGALQFTNTGNVAFAGVQSGTPTSGNRTLTLTGTNVDTNTIAAVLSNNSSGTGSNPVGSTSLQKENTGTWAITGNNTYSGGTNVRAGTLLVNNTAGSGTGFGNVTVNLGATLGGRGTISPSGANSVNVLGTVSAGTPEVGNGIGTLTFSPGTGDVTFGSTSNAIFQLGANGTNGLILTYNGDGTINTVAGTPSTTGNDRIVFASTSSGKLDFANALTGSLDIVFAAGYTPQELDAFDLMDWSNVSGPSVEGLSTALLDLPSLAEFGLSWDTSHFVSHGIIAIVPEPGRAMLLFAGLASLFFKRRRAAGVTF